MLLVYLNIVIRFLFYLAPPRWQVQPQDIITTIGNSVTISCIASGSPQPTYTWRKYSGTSFDDFMLICTQRRSYFMYKY